jgi:hypothetical protein
MNQEWAQTIGYLASALVGGVITYFVQTRISELNSIREKLRDEQRKVYIQMIEPFIDVITAGADKTKNALIGKMPVGEYRKLVIWLELYGSDQVVNSYNNMQQRMYKKQESTKPEEVAKLYSAFLLEVRKSLGNKNTKLGSKDMLKGFINDIDKYWVGN